MAIDWETFQNNLIDFFEKHNAKDENDAATFISDEYQNAISQGVDAVWGTQYLSGEIDLFKEQLKLGFNSAKKSRVPDPTFLYQFVNAGLLAFWSTVQFSLGVTPVLASATVASLTTNLITSPGILPPFVLQNTENASDLAQVLRKSFQQHASTIVGQTVGVTTVPAVFTAPWTGVI